MVSLLYELISFLFWSSLLVPFSSCEQSIKIEKIEGVNGITPQTVNRLAVNGPTTVQAVLSSSTVIIATIPGIPEPLAKKILDACTRVTAMDGFKTALALYEIQSVRITSGSSALDKLLGGGVGCGTMLEIHGEAGVGKTQVCHSRSQKPG